MHLPLSKLTNISIHPLRGEWDYAEVIGYFDKCYFNPPTPWGVGLHLKSFKVKTGDDFNPPTPWGVGLAKLRKRL